MPIYTYKCPTCEVETEVSHPMASEPTIICPECSIPKIKIPNLAAVTFRGSGWGHQ